MTTNQVLVAAKGYLLTHGWQQRNLGHGNGGPVCLLGATGYVTDMKRDLYDPADVVLAGTVGVEDPNELADWNDTPGRTLDEVIAVLDRAILATAPPLDDTPIFQALESLPAEDYIEALSVLALIPEGALA